MSITNCKESISKIGQHYLWPTVKYLPGLEDISVSISTDQVEEAVFILYWSRLQFNIHDCKNIINTNLNIGLFINTADRSENLKLWNNSFFLLSNELPTYLSLLLLPAKRNTLYVLRDTVNISMSVMVTESKGKF